MSAYANLSEPQRQKMREASRRYYWKNVEAGRERSRKYQKTYTQKHLDAVRNSNLKKSYGITVEQYEEMLKKQNNCCALCGEPFVGKTGRGRPHVDHNHETDEVRGLLHHNCNVALGFIEKNPKILENAKRYLQCE